MQCLWLRYIVVSVFVACGLGLWLKYLLFMARSISWLTLLLPAIVLLWFIVVCFLSPLDVSVTIYRNFIFVAVPNIDTYLDNKQIPYAEI